MRGHAGRQAPRLRILSAERCLALVVDSLRRRQHRHLDCRCRSMSTFWRMAFGCQLPVKSGCPSAVRGVAARPAASWDHLRGRHGHGRAPVEVSRIAATAAAARGYACRTVPAACRADYHWIARMATGTRLPPFCILWSGGMGGEPESGNLYVESRRSRLGTRAPLGCGVRVPDRHPSREQQHQIGQLSPFDLVLLLVLSNAVQNSMNGGDNSLVGGLISTAATLVTLNYTVRLRHLQEQADRRRWSRGIPQVIIVHNSQIFEDVMAARSAHAPRAPRSAAPGRLFGAEEVRAAILENNGSISVVMRSGQTGSSGSDGGAHR